MKMCSTCGREKHDKDFPAKGRRCKKCAAAATSAWYAKKSQDENARRAIQKRRNDWRQNKLRTDPAYRERHLAKRRVRNAKNAEKNNPKERARMAARLRTAQGRASYLLTTARMRDHECDLLLADVLPTIETGACPRTGFKFDLTPHAEHHRNPFSPSIDRIDGTKGYIKGNIQIVCSWYNIAKNEYSDAQMLGFCQAVIDAAPKSGV